MKLFCLTAYYLFFLTFQIKAQTADSKPIPFKDQFFLVSANIESIHFKTANNHSYYKAELLEFGFGKTILRPQWIFDAALEIYAPIQQDFNGIRDFSDGFGTGLQFGVIYDFMNHNIRAPGYFWAPMLAIRYFDLESHALKENFFGQDSSIGRIRKISFRTRGLMIDFPTLVFGKFKEARLDDRKIENMLTRIEGYRLSIGLSLPIKASYSSSFERLEPDQTPSQNLSWKENRDSNTWRGYSIRIGLNSTIGI